MTDLHKHFQKIFDKSVCLYEFKKILKEEKREALIGRGTHFTCYTIPGGLCLKRAHRSFTANEIAFRRWQDALRGVKPFFMWPPFELIQHEDEWAIIMPLLDKISIHLDSIDVQANIFEQELKSQGFQIKDTLQVGSLQGELCVYDLSGLRLL